MGSPVSAVVANFYMELFEEVALQFSTSETKVMEDNTWTIRV